MTSATKEHHETKSEHGLTKADAKDLTPATKPVPLPEMTLRDYLAGQALAGSIQLTHILFRSVDGKTETGYQGSALSVGEICYALADSLMAEREKNPEEVEAEALIR